MRLLQLSVADERREAVCAVLEDRDLGYTMAEGAAEQADRTIISVLVPADALELILDELEEEGYDRDTFTAVIDAEFGRFEGVDEVQNRWGSTPNRLAPASLRAKAKDLRMNARSFVWMMVLSAVVATGGLFLGSPAIVVGSMVIAPIVNPVLTACVGGVRDDRELVVGSVHMQAYGLVVAVAAAAITAWAAGWSGAVSTELAIDTVELLTLRSSPTILSLAVGLAAGAAGAWGLATKGRVTIVGVMIAAALIPTAATVGIGIAWRDAAFAAGAAVLLVLSVIAVNVGAILTLLYLEYRPDEVDESLLDVGDIRRAVVVGATALLVIATVLTTAGLFYEQSGLERSSNEAVSAVLAQPAYDGLGVESIAIEYGAAPAPESPTVTVVIAGPDAHASAYPELPAAFEDAIRERADREVTVRVRYIEFDYAGE